MYCRKYNWGKGIRYKITDNKHNCLHAEAIFTVQKAAIVVQSAQGDSNNSVQ
jgi:hypothetical protein